MITLPMLSRHSLYFRCWAPGPAGLCCAALPSWMYPAPGSSHAAPTPRGGGAAFVVLVILGLLLLQVQFAEILAISGGFVAVLGLVG